MSRTMMLEELGLLLEHVGTTDCSPDSCRALIVEQNCLGKRSGKTRTLTFKHLVDLYSLSRAVTIFRGMLYFWERDTASRSQLALLCTYARDPLFRQSATYLQQCPIGGTVTRESIEELIEKVEQGRFSPATLKSAAQNINATWTQSGHLTGKVRKIRTVSTPGPGSVAYALFLGYLSGVRGKLLLQSEFVSILDCPYAKTLELAEEASRRGWLVFKRIGDVIEVQFPNLMTEQEMGWLREQG